MSAPRKVAVISAADEGYFYLLRGLIQSIYDHRPAPDAVDICVIDVGMSPEQLEELRPLVTQIVPGRWDFDFPAIPNTPLWVRAQTARPFLPEYFPGYDYYIWLDGDTWLQDWRTIELLLIERDEGGIAIVPEIHRTYPYMFGMGELRKFNYTRVAQSFGEEAARLLDPLPIMNSGVFSVLRESRVWSEYRQFVQVGYRRSVSKYTEQHALNLAIYTRELSLQLLPAWSNWVSIYALPFFDPVRKCLCEPIAPFEKISVVHITTVNKAPFSFQTPSRQTVDLPIDYLGFQKAIQSPAYSALT